MIPIIPYSYYYWVGGPPKGSLFWKLLILSAALEAFDFLVSQPIL